MKGNPKENTIDNKESEDLSWEAESHPCLSFPKGETEAESWKQLF